MCLITLDRYHLRISINSAIKLESELQNITFKSALIECFHAAFFSPGVARYGSPQETPAPPPACQRPDRPDGGQHLLHHPAASPLHNGPQCYGAQGVLHRGMQDTEVTPVNQNSCSECFLIYQINKCLWIMSNGTILWYGAIRHMVQRHLRLRSPKFSQKIKTEICAHPPFMTSSVK